MRRFAVLSLLVLAHCAPEAAIDAGGDAPLDAPAPRDVPRDLGPPCELSCGVGEGCCVVEGAPACVLLESDPTSCGLCGLDCIAARRGDACNAGRCACGRFDIGCTGAPDVCCPEIAGVVEAHCANLDVAEQDCGECGRSCVVGQASECRSGECLCPGSGRACAGTAEDLCCPVGVGAAVDTCVDTRTDREHCGACGRRCTLSQRCDAGRCVSIFDVPPPDAGSEDAGDDASPLDAGVDGS